MPATVPRVTPWRCVFLKVSKGLAMNSSHSDSPLPRQATGRREGLVLMLGSSLTIMGAVMVAPILPKLGAEFGQGEGLVEDGLEAGRVDGPDHVVLVPAAADGQTQFAAVKARFRQADIELPADTRPRPISDARKGLLYI